MISSAPYTITEPIARGGRAILYRAIRNADGCRVVLKVLDARGSRPQDLEQLQQEYEIGKQLDTPAVVRPLALETHQGMPALVMEDFGGEALDRLLGAPVAVERFLELAVAIADAVADIHHRGVVHKDLKPSNILVNQATGEVKLADLGLASLLSRELRHTPSPGLIEGSFPYLSPEQTGRTDCAIDSRTDLYALGITFHQMLTGRLPFEARDPLEWVHCHVARAPPKASEIVPSVPEAIASIVLKLLSKMPEERYQSAHGLRRDLERCARALRASTRLEPFTPGEEDVFERLQIPEKLYGRQAETTLLHQAFSRVATTAMPELLLIAGYSGIGKSALVRDLEKKAVRGKGLFVSGKFEQHKRDIPYATLVRAFRDLVLTIFAEREPKVAAFRERMLGALGADAQLIVEVIREVELVIGRTAPPPELAPAEAQRRFCTVFRHFIGVFAQKEHPLVLFLDDLQWADAASLVLLEELMSHPEVHHLLIIGAYRDNEVSVVHPLASTLNEVRAAGARVSEIVLGPIPPEHLSAFVGEALHCRLEQAIPLATLVGEKTAGNPFFAIQFLTSLHEEGLLQCDASTGALRWDIARIHGKDFTDNVADLMVGKVKRLPDGAQAALRQLSCLGNSAEVASLTMVRGTSESDIHADFEEAVRAGLVIRLPSAYKFLHDRVQEVAYALVPEGERAAVHLGIGRQILSGTAPQDLAENIFEIVSQLNRGAALITAPEERARVAELNLVAGRRAKRSTAYASALTFLAAGSAMLAEDCWERHYEIAFALELHRAECEYLTGDLAGAEARLGSLARRAVGIVDVAAVTCARFELYTTQARSDAGVEAGLEFLKVIDVAWSPHPTSEEVRAEIERMWQTLGSRSIEDILDLPAVADPRWRATMDVLTMLVPSAVFTDRNLFCLVIARIANLSLEHGNSDGSCFAYAWLGVLLGAHFGDYRAGFRFGKVGLDLVEKRGLLRFRARVHALFSGVLSFWSKHAREGRGLVQRAFAMAREAGDLTFAAYACTMLVALRFAAGDPLGEVEREAEHCVEFARQTRFGFVVDIITGQLQLVRALRGATTGLSSLGDAAFDDAAFEARLEGVPHVAMATCKYWICKLEAGFHAGDFAAALDAADHVEPILWALPALPEEAEYRAYHALSLAASLDTAPAGARPRRLEALLAHHRQMEIWAENCPPNFSSRVALCGAEIARLGGDTERAAALYEQAIRAAREHGLVHHEAIAFEVAARFYRARGFELIADTYLREARACYARWGAEGKVQQLDREHPGLVEPKPLAAAATVAVRTEQLDLHSVIKASQTISGEVVLDELGATLLEVVLEQGGAQRACLISSRDENLTLEAEAILDEGGVATSRGAAPIDGSQRVPASLIHYAYRMRERVIVADAAADAGRFAGDDYFARRRLRSILCMPILRQGEVVALLYLENGLLAGAFTPDRLAALSLLATQAAISLENARLLAQERAAREAAEFLAEAGAVLSESLDCEETFARLGRLCVRSLADWCAIDIVEGHEIRRLAVAHKDPGQEPLLIEVRDRYPPRWGSRHPAARVLRTGEPMLSADLSDEALSEICHDEEHVRLARALGTRTGLSVPLIARGQLLGVLSLASAAPERRYGRAELELAQEVAHRAAIAIDNARLYRALQDAVRARNEFLTVASHELNTPMTSLVLAVQSLRRADATGRPLDVTAMRRLVDLASRQGTRLTRLISDLLDLSRIEAGAMSLELTDVDLGALVREVVLRFEADLSLSRCAISIHESEQVIGTWDRSRIDQIVTNLLSNAIKFGAGKPIMIAIGAERGLARLAIRDQGIGIEEHKRAVIFERFERAVSERHYGGLGLGLYISRRIVEDHGGTIGCESRKGAGSTFTVELPCAGPS
ncbi:Signal transduction histidine kinase CheA [Minicystis rosea]|nr:Signal transduction histidine kinase CheA [Minicystis rosea]